MKKKDDGNVITDTYRFFKKEVSSAERGIEKRANAIATHYLLFGAALGVTVGIVGTALYERFVGPTYLQTTLPKA